MHFQEKILFFCATIFIFYSVPDKSLSPRYIWSFNSPFCKIKKFKIFLNTFKNIIHLSYDSMRKINIGEIKKRQREIKRIQSIFQNPGKNITEIFAVIQMS